MLSVVGFVRESRKSSAFEDLKHRTHAFLRQFQHRNSMTSVFEHGLVRLLRVRGFMSHFVPTDSGMIHVMTGAGSGNMAPVALFHGLASCGAHYTGMMRHLRKEVRELILPDAPGHGQSSTPPDEQSHAEFQAALNKSVAALITEPAVIFGNSMGGFLGLRFALAHPEKVRALILCSPGGAAMSQNELDDFLNLFRIKTHRESLDFLKRAFGGFHGDLAESELNLRILLRVHRRVHHFVHPFFAALERAHGDEHRRLGFKLAGLAERGAVNIDGAANEFAFHFPLVHAGIAIKLQATAEFGFVCLRDCG